MNTVTCESNAPEIKRATLAYHQIEDRLSLTCAFHDSELIVLWLTARLINQLVPHLCKVIAQVPELSKDLTDLTANGAAVAAAITHQDAEAGMSGANRTELTSGAEVVAKEGCISWVVTSVDIRQSPMLVQLVFRHNHENQRRVSLSLEHTLLVQWLNGLRRCYVQAGWPMESWQTPISPSSDGRTARQFSIH